MKMRFSSKALRLVKLSVLFLIGSQILFITPSYAQKDWKLYVKTLVSSLAENRKPAGQVYVHLLRDESNRQIYYPFMETVRKVMINEFRVKGYVVSTTPVNADSYIMTTFLERPDGLFLNALQLDAEDGSTVLGSTAVEIPVASLPEHWDKRSLRDLAYELVVKLGQKLFAQKARIILGEFSGGYNKKDAYVSEFSFAMKDYIKEELTKSGGFVILTPSRGKGRDDSAAILTGHYIASANDIIFRLILQKGQQPRREIANVSTEFGKASVPPGMAIFPQNVETASQNTDIKDDETDYSTGVPITVWLNKRSGIYYNNDKLVINLRPQVDCYARVYYIQSDGAVVQIFPSNAHESGFLKKGPVYEVGGKDDDVDLVITNETVGQEFIKVFAARVPIDDSSIPKDVIRGANVLGIRIKYRSLKESLARGIHVSRKKLLPAAEVKLLVK